MGYALRKIDLTYVNVCADCMIAAVNDDYTGMGDGKEAIVRDGLDRVGYMVYVEDCGFSYAPCGCCGEKLHGDRYKMAIL